MTLLSQSNQHILKKRGNRVSEKIHTQTDTSVGGNVSDRKGHSHAMLTGENGAFN